MLIYLSNSWFPSIINCGIYNWHLTLLLKDSLIKDNKCNYPSWQLSNEEEGGNKTAENAFPLSLPFHSAAFVCQTECHAVFALSSAHGVPELSLGREKVHEMYANLVKVKPRKSAVSSTFVSKIQKPK